MNVLVAYAENNGPVFWIVIFAALLTIEVINGRGWVVWSAIGAGVAAGLTAALSLSLGLEALAFAAATVIGLGYALLARAARRRAMRA